MSFSLRNLCAAAVVLFLGLAIYANVLHGEFQFDDVDFIVQSEAIRDLTNPRGIWFDLGHPSRFITLYTFALNYHFHELDVFGYHLVNVFIHIANALLAAWLIFLILSLQSFQRDRCFIISWFAALIFLTHPLQTEAVSYICQRYASLATLFYLLALCLYIQARTQSVLKKCCGVGALISVVLAMFSKQIAFTLPFVVILIEMYFLQPKGFLRTWNRQKTLGLIGVLSFIFVVPAFFSFDIQYVLLSELPSRSNSDSVLTSLTYFMTQPRVILTYLKLLFFPIGQTLDYDFPLSKSLLDIPTAMSFITLIILFCTSIFLFKKNRLLSFGLIWMFITMSVESSIIPIPHVIFEHRMYLPMVGISLVLSVLLESLMRSRRKAVAVVIVIVMTLSYLTVQRNNVWKDGIAMWTDALEKAPHKPRPYHNLGFIYLQKKDYSAAIDYFNQALEKEPRYFQAYHNRGDAYSELKDYKRAIQDYDLALKLNESAYNTLINRGNAYRNTKRFDEAIQDYNKSVEIYPNNPLVYNSRGVAFREIKRFNESIADFSQAIALNSQYVRAYNNRGAVYGLTKQYDKAILDFTKTLDLNPNFVEAYYNRSRAYLLTNQLEDAQSDVQEALKRNYPVPAKYLQKLHL